MKMDSTSPGAAMGESTAMTIEFLRARLLSERSVSRNARQRADQLAKRVLELEEQHRFMIIQRKKAEKLASQVLAILENQGICEFAEVTDSSSDRDGDNGRLKGNDVTKDETFTDSKIEKSEVEDGLSGLELEVSPSQGRNLTWKGRNRSPDSHENQKIQQFRQRQRHSSFTSTAESSGRHHLGMSCRRIKQKETRSAEEDELGKPILYGHPKRGATHSNHSDEQTFFPKEASRSEVEEVFPHTSLAFSLDDQIKETDAGLSSNRRDGDEEMERVLEQQALLIGQYEAEENAQKEWEEKYNENESSTLDFYEPENLRGAAETCSETKAEATMLAGEYSNYADEAAPRAEDEPAARILSNVSVPTVRTPHTIDPEKRGSSEIVTAIGLSEGFVCTVPTRSGRTSPQACSDGVLVQQYNGTVSQDTISTLREIEFPAQEHRNISTNGKANEGMLHGNAETNSHNVSSSHPHGNGIIDSPSSGSSSSVNSSSKFSKWQSPEVKNQLQIMLPQSPSSRLGGVLQALQRAKTSLGQLSEYPLSNQGTLVTVAPTDSHVRPLSYGGDSEIPISTSGLFRLPTDSFPQAGVSMPKLYNSRLSLASTYPVVGYTIASNDYGYPAATNVESGSRVSIGRQYFDPYTSASNRYSLPYSNLTTERSPYWDGSSRSGMSLRNEMSAGDRYSLYGGDSALSDMRRL